MHISCAAIYDVMIVGAGPAGSTAAILLAQAGWSVALIERDSFPRRKVCGECIAASNLALLQALGVGEQVAALAGPELRRVALMCGRHTISADLPAAQCAPRPWGRALGREQLDSLLLERARALGVAVWQPFSAQGLSGSAGDFQCELRQAPSAGAVARPVILRAPVAIAAHGSWQALPAERRAVHRPQVRARDLLAFKANFAGARLAPGLLPVLSFAGGYGGMVLADGGTTTLACCIRPARLQACRRAASGAPAGEIVEEYLRKQCRGVDDALREAKRIGPWLAVGPIRPGVHLPWTAPTSPFRIGNAAGEAHPIIGEGISMALQSAWLLCAQLISTSQSRPDEDAAVAQNTIQRRYAAAWRRQFGTRLRLAACFAGAAMHPRLVNALMPLLCRAPGILTHGARWSGKIRSLRTFGDRPDAARRAPEELQS